MNQHVYGIALYGNLVWAPALSGQRTADDLLADPCGRGYLKERSASIGRPDHIVPFRIRRADSHAIHAGIVGPDRRFDVGTFVQSGPFHPATAGVGR